jgi:hypothetical protein
VSEAKVKSQVIAVDNTISFINLLVQKLFFIARITSLSFL